MLKHFSIPPGMKQIGNYAFFECVSLIQVTISSPVASVGHGAFPSVTKIVKS